MNIDKIELFCEKRKKEIFDTPDCLEISGNIYYVSNSGSDENDGKSPNTAWKSLDKVSSVEFAYGDGVLFKRGDLFRGEVYTKSGVTYGAYGEGEKPKFYSWDENLASPNLWELVDEKHSIWKYTKEISDCGTLVFNGEKAVSRKLIPSYIGGRFVTRDDISRPFVMADEMTNDLDIFCRYDKRLHTRPSKGEDFPVPVIDSDSLGELYLRCDRGNPGEVFDSIEAIANRRAFRINKNSDVRIDNICIKYYCFGVSSVGTTSGLTVTNCVVGYVGGNIQNYEGVDPNHPAGIRGEVTRFGNGVEIYGGCDKFTVHNCYIYQSYDAGITHQLTTAQKRTMTNVKYTDNVIEHCVYGIECWLNKREGGEESFMDNITFDGNIVRLSGYGWGQQRHNTDTPALIKNWNFENTAANFKITNNIFDRSAYRMLHLGALEESSLPVLQGNTYIQHLGGSLGQYWASKNGEVQELAFDENAEDTVKNIFGDKTAKVYII